MNNLCGFVLILKTDNLRKRQEMRITLAYNLRTKDTEEQAELLLPGDIAHIYQTLKDLKHTVTPVEVSGKADEIIEKLVKSKPDFIFNIAEGVNGEAREAFYPMIYENLDIPFTGSKASLLLLSLNKHLTKSVLEAQGINVPKGVLITNENRHIPDKLKYPLIIKPNTEGSSKGITQESVVNNKNDCKKRLDELLEKYPSGIIVEEFIYGRELTVPMLEAFPGQILCIVEHIFDLNAMNAKYNIYDFDSKFNKNKNKVKIVCPAELNKNEYDKIIEISKRIFKIMNCKDFGRIDIRLSKDGIPYFIEINPLPSLLLNASLTEAAKCKGISYKNVIDLILKSATRNYKLNKSQNNINENIKDFQVQMRPTLREAGISIGYFKPGPNNAINDVKGVKVGHFTRLQTHEEIPGISESSCVRTGVTAVLPVEGNIFDNPIPAGGFVLNGIGEMAGITQVLEWEWLETPILLCNTMSVGRVHDGVITYMLEKYPSIVKNRKVIIPVIGETNDSFLNDYHLRTVSAPDVKRAMNNAKSGPVKQGSIGAGTGMTSFDFAGGIGTSSRVLSPEDGGYTLGVLVLSNLGKMRNLTIDGMLVGRELDKIFSNTKRRADDLGSIIVVVATDAPLLSSQLNRISKRAALGLGRVGSHARTTSGEIVISFSTGNQVNREKLNKEKYLNLRFATDKIVNLLYEAVIEAVEEAVVNAMFCSSGMSGCRGNYSPAIPHNEVINMLKNER